MSQIPEIPYPFRPGPRPAEQPPSPQQPHVPLVGEPASDVYGRLFERRLLFVHGRLDEPAVTDLCAQLMTLDTSSSRPITLVVNSRGGPLTDVFALLDTMELARPPIDTTCVGEALGTAAAVLALGSGTRRAARSATIRLRLDEHHAIDGDAQTTTQHAERLLAARHLLASMLARRTGHDPAVLEGWLETDAFLSADEAVAAGLVDAVAGEDDR
ncbi:MAG: ATP-dependent Clp protease proteolytic subunit [Egibacteraceae bacterium]